MHAVAAGLRLGVARRPAPYANHKRHDAAHTHAGKRIHTHAHMWIQSATLSHDAFAATPTERRTSRLKYIVCVALTATGGDTCEPCAPAAHTIVRFSSGQQLIFDERDHAPPADARERSVVAAYHVALYCDHVETFEAARAACEADGRVIVNARFAGLPSEQLSTQFRVERLGTAADAARARAAEAAEAGAEAEAEAGAEAEAEVEYEAEGAEAALLLEVQVLSIAHPSCPLTRADLVRSLLDRACQHAAHQPHTPPASMQPTTSPTHASCPTRLLPHTPPPPVRR